LHTKTNSVNKNVKYNNLC